MSKLSIVFPLACLLAATLPAQPRAARSDRTAAGDKGLVVSGRAQATDAGLTILANGGNAADAGAATLLALSVTTVGAFCIGGEVPILVYDAAANDVKVLAGQGGAPLNPQAIEWYLANGIPDKEVKAAAVPATVDAVVTLLKLYGTMSFSEVVEPTLAILDAGGPSWYTDTSDQTKIETGTDWRAGLAVTLRKLAAAEQTGQAARLDGLQAVADRFYRGDIADSLEQWYIEEGGFLRKADLAAHKTRVEEPLTTAYRDCTVYKCGPWTQGPSLLQALRLIENFDVKQMGFQSADYIHVITEAMKLAFADRDEYYADPEFVKVPIETLLSDAYTRLRLPLIILNRASIEVRPGDPYRMRAVKQPRPVSPAPGGTTTMCVTDRWGNVIAATPSGLGSTAGVAGDTGIIHGTRLTSLNSWPGHPNVIEAGKRPRITLTPTLVLKKGKPVMAISVAGGDLQDQAALQLILEYVDFGMNADEAFSARRFSTRHHTDSFGQAGPELGSLRVSDQLPVDVQNELRRRGHHLRTMEGNVGGIGLIVFQPETGMAHGAGSSAKAF